MNKSQGREWLTRGGTLGCVCLLGYNMIWAEAAAPVLFLASVPIKVSTCQPTLLCPSTHVYLEQTIPDAHEPAQAPAAAEAQASATNACSLSERAAGSSVFFWKEGGGEDRDVVNGEAQET